MKQKQYALLADQLRALVAHERNMTANLANASALIYHALDDVNWAGFYIMNRGELVLGPFQGQPACIRIAVGRGVCGAAVEHRKTQLVENVHAFSGHIACDAASASEVVVPLLYGGAVVGVLDIDSPVKGRFDEDDRAGLELLASILQSACDWSGALELRLVQPSLEHEAQALSLKETCMATDGSLQGGGGLQQASSYRAWLEALCLNASEETVQDGLVPASTYLAQRILDGKIVGIIDIRHRLNEFLLQFGGNIGYSIRPDERRKGYAAQMLALALEACRALGMTRALLACDKENAASAKTMLRNGAVLENEVPEDDGITQRYWIELTE